jgi:hypothetical protein
MNNDDTPDKHHEIYLRIASIALEMCNRQGLMPALLEEAEKRLGVKLTLKTLEQYGGELGDEIAGRGLGEDPIDMAPLDKGIADMWKNLPGLPDGYRIEERSKLPIFDPPKGMSTGVFIARVSDGRWYVFYPYLRPGPPLPYCSFPTGSLW